MPKHAIAVIAFDRISPFHLAVPCVVFGDVHPGVPPFRLMVCAGEEGRLTTTAGFDVLVRHGLEALEIADAIIVPSWRDPDERPPQALLAALVAAHRRGAQVVGLCLGAYVLAEAGLLDGRRATTHWGFAQDFARRYPQVHLDAGVLYIDDGNILTSAGTAAGIDCCLHMLRQWYGAELANSVARRLVVPDSLAERALLSRRTFTRHFRQLTGATVGCWLLGERLALTQRLLETTDQPVESIALLAGFGSPESLRHHFRKAFGVPPMTWRQSFKG